MAKKNPFADSRGYDAVDQAPIVISRAAVDPLKQAQDALAVHEAKIESLGLEIKQLEVKDAGSASLMTAKAGFLKQLLDAIDKERLLIISEPDKFVRTVNGMVLNFKKTIKKYTDLADSKMRPYQYQLELERREEEKKMQQAIAKRQVEMDKAAKKAGVERVVLPDALVPVERESIRTDTGSVSYKPVWVAKIVDPALVPREYCSPDQKKIDAAVDAGIRTIAGVEIKEEMKSRWSSR
jgi:DNA-binding protein H-NS